MVVITLKMEMYMKMIYLRMGYIYKTLAKKVLSHNFIANLQTYVFRKANMVPKYRSTRDSGLASAIGKSDLQMLYDLRFEYQKSCCVAI